MFEDRTMLDPGAGQPLDAEQTQQLPGGPFEAPSGGFIYSDSTQQAISITCAVCQTPNVPGERWCQDCGFLLGSVVADPGEVPDATTLPRLVAAANGGREHTLQPGENFVGRENTDVLLDDPQVSRRHARLLLGEGSLLVEDLNSTNGTHVAGRRLDSGASAEAYDGDEVRFGGTRLRAVLPGFPARPAEVTRAMASDPGPSAPTQDRGERVAAMQREDGHEFPLYVGVNTVGRRSTNDICITGDPFVSGQHAEVHFRSGEVFVVDIGSTNGTFLDGVKIAPNVERALVAGEVVQFGKSRLTLSPFEAQAAPLEATVALDVASPGELTDEPADDAGVRSIEIP